MNLMTTGLGTLPQGHTRTPVIRAVGKGSPRPWLLERALYLESEDMNSSPGFTFTSSSPVEAVPLGASVSPTVKG